MAIGIIWKIFSSKQLNIAIQAFSLIAIFFKGYDQGVMGGVNASPDYVTTVGIGLPNGTFTNTTHQSGIVSIVSQNIDFRCVSKSLMVYSTTLALLSVPS